jgi:hypothetical protein
MSTILANEKFDSIIEESWSMLREDRLALLNEVKRIWWALTKRTYIAVALLTTIRVHTVSQTIWNKKQSKYWYFALFMQNGEKIYNIKLTNHILSSESVQIYVFSWIITHWVYMASQRNSKHFVWDSLAFVSWRILFM